MASRSSVKPQVRPPEYKGCEVPRIFTPPLRELTEETSLGFMMIEFASEVLGITLFPWQRWLLIHAFELHPMWTVSTMGERGSLDPLFRFRKVIVLVARQNGKTVISQVVALFFIYALGVSLILGTAQDLDTAEEVWEGCLDLIEENPDLQDLADKPIKVNGKKTIRLKTGERYKVKAANRKAGRGLSGDLIMLDELREHQSWDAWAAITKTATARAAAMILCLSNAGDMSSVVLRFLRLACHEALGDPDGLVAESKRQALLPTVDDIAEFRELDDDDLEDYEPNPDDLAPEDFEEDLDALGLFEWSSPPGCAVDDREGLAQANPSVGYGITWRVLLADAITEGRDPETEWVFRTEAMCQWPEVGMHGVFPPGKWEATTNDQPRAITSDVTACVTVSGDRSRAWIALCGTRDDGEVQADVVATARGFAWVAGWLTEHKDRIECVTLQERGAGAASELYKALEIDPKFQIPLVPWAGPTLTAWHGQTHDAIRDKKLFHNSHPALDRAAGGATKKPLAGGWVLDLFDARVDGSPLAAVCGAYGCFIRPAIPLPPLPSTPQVIHTKTAPTARPGVGSMISAADVRTIRF